MDDFEIALLNLEWWLLSREQSLWLGSNDNGYRIEMPKADLDALEIKHKVKYAMLVGG